MISMDAMATVGACAWGAPMRSPGNGNGDTLSATFTGQATPTSTPGLLTIVETATITGGTGRFSDATGTFTAQRVFNQLTGVTTGSFEGRIS